MKVAVIGTGFGKHAAAPAYQDLGLDVEVISPRDEQAVKRALASDVDLVSVHSPPFMHLDHVTGAIEHGLAVLCDKPFGRNADEAAAMRDRARKAGVLHFLNFEFRCNESWAKIKQLTDAGTIGAPAEDAYSAWFVMENGCTATHDTGFAAAVPMNPRVAVMGSAGSIELIGDTKLVVQRAGNEPETFEFAAPPRRTPPRALSSFLGQVAEAVRTGIQISPSFDDGLATAEAMDRLRAKAIRATG